MENSLVTYGFNKYREGIEHLKWICDLCSLHSLQVKKIIIIGNVTAKKFLKERLPHIANMLFVSKNISLEKVAFMNSSCFVICELNWIDFMPIVKHFRVKLRLASFCCVNLNKYTMPREFVFIVCRKFDFHPQNYLQNLLFAYNKVFEWCSCLLWWYLTIREHFVKKYW